jgi:hypothetical protein
MRIPQINLTYLSLSLYPATYCCIVVRSYRRRRRASRWKLYGLIMGDDLVDASPACGGLRFSETHRIGSGTDIILIKKKSVSGMRLVSPPHLIPDWRSISRIVMLPRAKCLEYELITSLVSFADPSLRDEAICRCKKSDWSQRWDGVCDLSSSMIRLGKCSKANVRAPECS